MGIHNEMMYIDATASHICNPTIPLIRFNLIKAEEADYETIGNRTLDFGFKENKDANKVKTRGEEKLFLDLVHWGP